MSERQSRQRKVAAALRTLTGMAGAPGCWGVITPDEAQAIRIACETAELGVRMRYAEEQRAYGSKCVISVKLTREQYREERERIMRRSP